MNATIESPLPIFTTDDDQPTNCPKCGVRTDIETEISDTEQHQKCPQCSYEFIMILEA